MSFPLSFQAAGRSDSSSSSSFSSPCSIFSLRLEGQFPSVSVQKITYHVRGQHVLSREAGEAGKGQVKQTSSSFDKLFQEGASTVSCYSSRSVFAFGPRSSQEYYL